MEFSSKVRHRPGPVLAIGLGIALGLVVNVVVLLCTALVIVVLAGAMGVTVALVMSTVIRSLVSLLLLLLTVGFGVRRFGGSLNYWLAVAGVAYVVDIYSWGGNTLFTASLIGGFADQSMTARVVGFFVDLLIWCGVAAGAWSLGRVRSRQ